jgi:hypothetical protein
MKEGRWGVRLHGIRGFRCRAVSCDSRAEQSIGLRARVLRVRGRINGYNAAREMPRIEEDGLR